MRRNRFAAAAGLTLALALALWSAPSHAYPSAGGSEALVAGGFFHQQDSDDGTLNLDLSYGYYLTPGWQIGLRQALNFVFIDDASDRWEATTTPFLHYNFRLGDVAVPYLGVSGGLVWNDRDATGTIGPNAGLKLFLTPQTFINLGYRYEWFFNSLERADDNKSDGNHVGNIGIGFSWGGSGARTTR
jgi:hypothetical protein